MLVSLRASPLRLFHLVVPSRPHSRLESGSTHQRRPLGSVGADGATVQLEHRDMRQFMAQHFVEQLRRRSQQSRIQPNNPQCWHAAPKRAAQAGTEAYRHSGRQCGHPPDCRPIDNAGVSDF